MPFADFEALSHLRAEPPHPVIEGLMLKRWDSAYVPGRPKGPWFKWKQDPHLIDAVLMYAQRGHGKRSSFYSDYTFGVWTGPADQPELVPVGKAYFGFTDEELKQLDKYIRDNTIDRFGPIMGWCWKWPSRGWRARRATSRASPCAFRACRACVGTSPPSRRIGWKRSRPCWNEPRLASPQSRLYLQGLKPGREEVPCPAD